MNTEIIESVEEIVSHRLTSSAKQSGKWIVWDCRLSGKTMDKFVDRVKKQTGRPVFFRDSKFGVLAD